MAIMVETREDIAFAFILQAMRAGSFNISYDYVIIDGFRRADEFLALKKLPPGTYE